MDFVETKFFYKNRVLDLKLKNENMSKKWPQKLKKCDFEQQHIQNEVTLEKYLNIFFKKLTQKLINFKTLFGWKSTQKLCFQPIMFGKQ